METAFSALKKNRSSALKKLDGLIDKVNKGGFKSNDENIWKLEVDKAGNGSAVIRFLPAPKDEDEPFVRMWSHGFKGPGGQWYIENSLTTLKQDDPASEYNSKLWNEDGSEKALAQARDQKRKLSFYSNIYVVKDPKQPENEGKVFKFRYGKKIFDKLNDAMYPDVDVDDEKPINPFDLWDGADFLLKQRKVESYPNYDKSSFSDQSIIKTPDGKKMTDKQMEEVWESQFSLSDIIDPKNFESYETLKTKLYKVLQLKSGIPISAEVDNVSEIKEPSESPELDSPVIETAQGDDEDGLDFFRELSK